MEENYINYIESVSALTVAPTWSRLEVTLEVRT